MLNQEMAPICSYDGRQSHVIINLKIFFQVYLKESRMRSTIWNLTTKCKAE